MTAARLPGDLPEMDERQLLAIVSGLMHETGVGVLLTDPEQRIVYANPWLLRETGYGAGELLGRTPRVFQGQGTDAADRQALAEGIRAGRSTQREILNYRRDGTSLWQLVSVSPVRLGGRLRYFLGIQENRSPLREAQAELRRAAYRDPLTGLRNRRAFEEDLKWAWDRAQAGEHRVLMVLDLNDFKAVNDSQGHLAGDALLRQVGDDLRAVPGRAYRIGGDEFALLVPAAQADAVVGGLRASHSSGQAHSGERPWRDCWAWLHEADRRMYRHKRAAPAP